MTGSPVLVTPTSHGLCVLQGCASPPRLAVLSPDMGQSLQCVTPPQRPKGLSLCEVSATPPLNTAPLSCCSSEDELYGTYGLAHMDPPSWLRLACGVPLHCPDSPGASEPFLGQCDECELEGEYLVRQVPRESSSFPSWWLGCALCEECFAVCIADGEQLSD